ncbi:LTA synthase family protein [Aedoeadaptatus pacaensis]|uniref:LTA synthase family protein n=1 Tax=Aedoeadaptatus pacaensis TaxID=1776390 RepID=UPI0008397CC6|nr:LTA synthase family protein [Peptoniphilus pacaensis]
MKRQTFRWWPFLFMAVAGAVITLFTLYYACGSGPEREALFASYLTNPLLLFMNFLPVFCALVFLYALSGRMWLSFSLTGLLFFALSVVQQFKLMYRDEPFVMPEILLFRESLMMKGHYQLSIFASNPVTLIGLIVMIAVSVFLFLRDRKPLVGRGRRLLLLLSTAAIVFVFQGFSGPYFSSKVYARMGENAPINNLNSTENYKARGLVYPFVMSGRMFSGNKPENYDKKLAATMWEKVKEPEVPEEKKVHVISVMLESFADFSVYDNIPIHRDVYDSFHAIQREGVHGHMIADIFGGGTVNSERGFLTGFSGTGYAESVAMMSDTFSHVRYFKDNGYTAEALHPIYGWFYNRKNVNPRLGFDEYLCYDNYFQEVEEREGDTDWLYTRDNHFFPEVEKRMNAAVAEGKYYFSYALTYQGHGPYPDYNAADRHYVDMMEGQDPKDWAIFNNYLSNIAATDDALGQFVENLRNHPEPVVLIFFGDHKPGLGEGDSGYKSMGIDIDLSTLEGQMNYYTTPYVIWANDAAKAKLGKDFTGEGPDLSPFLLMRYLFDTMGWPHDAMMAVQDEYLPETTVLHMPYIRKDSEYRLVDDDPSLAEMVRQYHCMEYYRANEKVKK